MVTLMQDEVEYTVCATQSHIAQKLTFSARGQRRTRSTQTTADCVNTFTMLFLC